MSYKDSYLKHKKQNKKKKSLSLQSIFPIALFLLCVFVMLCLVKFAKSEDNVSLEDSSSLASRVNKTVSDVSSAPPKEIEGYTMLTMDSDDLSDGSLVLINNDNYFKGDVSSELLSMYDYKQDCYSISNSDVIIQPEMIEPLNRMLLNFYNKTGNGKINLTSGYRSEETQMRLYQDEVAQKGIEEAMHWVAYPGGSEHHSGYALDINIVDANGVSYEYTGEGEYSLLNKTAPDYGFIVRYEESKKHITGIYYEPWHLRYIGLPHSSIMRDKNMCLEEYISYIKDFTPDGKHLIYEFKEKTYEIYFCKGYNVYVPENSSSYAVSGNNIDGFIVTLIN